LEVVQMFRVSFSLVVVLLVAALAAGPGQSGDNKKDPVIKKLLPPNWKKLGLTDEQKQKIYTIRGNYGTKMDALKAQLDTLKKQEQKELMAVLTEEQKTNLRKILSGTVPETDKKGTTEKKTQPDKK
jgi:Spy/CpxP family protein refolding chaperone